MKKQQKPSKQCLKKKTLMLKCTWCQSLPENRQIYGGFIGSPTIQINGQDLEPNVDNQTPYQGHCRVYLYKDKPFEYPPPKEMIREALKRFT